MDMNTSFLGMLDNGSAFTTTREFLDIKSRAYEHVLTRIEELGAEFTRLSRAAVRRLVATEVERYALAHNAPLNENELAIVCDSLTKELTGYGPIEDLLQDPEVEDILINGSNSVWVSRRGRLKQVPVRFTDNEHLLRIVRRILAPIGRRLDESSPMVDARLVDGGRINAVIEPLALDGPVVSIRKFRKDPLSPQELIALGSFDTRVAELLEQAVKARCNILVSGGTSSGKTSLLNALASYVPGNERVVTIEDTAELALKHPHVVRLESRPGSFDGGGVVTIRDLVRNALRMRPDRIVVGEVRGPEVLEMLQAMNTGHDGSMGTIHASSPRECLYRLEMLAGFGGFQGSEASLRRQIASAVHFIVQIGRLGDGRRRVLSVTEVTGVADNVIATQELYRHEAGSEPGDERWVGSGIRPYTPRLAGFSAGGAGTLAESFGV